MNFSNKNHELRKNNQKLVNKTTNFLKLGMLLIILSIGTIGCNQPQKETEIVKESEKVETKTEAPDYFLLRPEVEKAYGYSHAVKIGNSIKVSGAVSMDDQGNPTAVGNLEQQMKNCYADLEKVLAHYGCTFDDVVVENVFTTNMPKFLEVAGYRAEIYKNHFPTGSWLGVKELALPEFLIEIEMEVYKA
jgi:enamine deaminase RidA (YjgF/YER057c/UK114 family)